MSLLDAELLTELLDRQFAYVLSAERERRLVLLSRLLAFLQTPPFDGLLEEGALEAQRSVEEYREHDRIVRAKLKELWLQHKAALLEVLQPDLQNPQLEFVGAEAYEKSLDEPSVIDFPAWSVTKDRTRAESLRLSLAHWCLWACQSLETKKAPPVTALKELHETLRQLGNAQQFVFRRFKLASESLAGVALIRLRAVANSLNPEPPTEEADLEKTLVRIVQFDKANRFASMIHDPDPVRPHPGVDEVLAAAHRVAEDVRLLHEDLRVQIGMARSRQILVRRFAARCEGFDAEQLRKMCEEDTRNAERRLTLTFARYLFDQGLNPVIDPTVSGLRPDVLDVSARTLFYVEAKQYADASPREAIIAGYKQVWGTWGRLRNRFEVPEAFLLVFRRAGPILELPPLLRHRGQRLHSVFSDISTAAGSREAQRPISFSEEELLPQPGDGEE